VRVSYHDCIALVNVMLSNITRPGNISVMLKAGVMFDLVLDAATLGMDVQLHNGPSPIFSGPISGLTILRDCKQVFCTLVCDKDGTTILRMLQ